MKFWIGVAVASFLVGSLSLGAHSLRVNYLEKQFEKKLEKQKTALVEKCNLDKAITAKVSHDLQKNLDTLDRQLAAARRLHGHKCSAVAPFTPAGRNAASAGKEPPGRDDGGTAPEGTIIFANTGSLIGIAGKGEKYRLQLKSCQAFVKAVQKAAAAR